MNHKTYSGLSRRDFLRVGLVTATGLVLSRHAGPVVSAPSASGNDVREFRVVAAEGEAEVVPGHPFRTWLYNGTFPGREIRVKEGERLRVTVENRLPEGTTVHWHGIPLPNAMDGVPGLTQAPIAPGQTFVYDFTARPAGTYMYHSHVGLQLDRGLLGPLIIEERQPHVAYDREYTLVLDDYLPRAPVPLSDLAERNNSDSARGGMGGRMGRMMGGGMMGGFVVPPYAGLLINGHLPENLPSFEVRQGERVRLRLLNPSSATTFRVAIGGHALVVTHADGQPVEPTAVDALVIGMGERYDVLIEAKSPGVWPIAAAAVEGDAPPARALLRYRGVREASPGTALPEGLSGGRLLDPFALRALSPLPAGRHDRAFDLALSGRGSTVWTINGKTFSDAEPLTIKSGERVRVRMVNRSMMLHPMHLHGHFFQVGGVIKDTVMIPPHMGRVSFDFIADNPGRWLFHCHNLYHMEAGMAREVRYG